MATGVRNEAAAATVTAIKAGRTDTPMSTAAERAIGITISAVAVLLINWPSVAVSTKSPMSSAYGPALPTPWTSV